MPGGDRTGPLGLGPLTGRGLGFCAGFPYPGYMNLGWGFGWGRGFGRGRGFGFGRGFGWRRAWAWPGVYGPFGLGFGRAFLSQAEVREDLEAYRAELKRELAAVEEKLAQEPQEKPAEE